MPVTPATTPVPTSASDAMSFAAVVGDAQNSIADDEVAPARHALTLPTDSAAAPSRIDAAGDTAATRTARAAMHPAIAQVAVSVTKAVQEGVERITIKLQPPELGRIDVRLEVGVDGRIQAVFAAERSATVEILQRDVRELERALQNAGLSTDAGGLSFGLKQNGGQNANAFAAFQQDQQSGTEPPAGDDVLPAARPTRGTVDGRLDIHV